MLRDRSRNYLIMHLILGGAIFGISLAILGNIYRLSFYFQYWCSIIFCINEYYLWWTKIFFRNVPQFHNSIWASNTSYHCLIWPSNTQWRSVSVDWPCIFNFSSIDRNIFMLHWKMFRRRIHLPSLIINNFGLFWYYIDLRFRHSDLFNQVASKRIKIAIISTNFRTNNLNQ